MYEVICPQCGDTRTVKAKKPWMKDQEEPFEKMCKPCSMTGKTHSQETRNKLSQIAKAQQTPELLQFKSQFMKDHPELWQNNLQQELGSQSRIGTHHTDEAKAKISASNTGKTRTAETRAKISQAMKKIRSQNESN